MADVKIKVTEEPNRVEVLYLGKAHAGGWNDEEEVDEDEGSDAAILAAALCAWDGSPEMAITDEELELSGGGWWKRP